MTHLLADRMLEGLARRLRLLGYDCETRTGSCRNDRAILERARSAGRVLLTTAHRLRALAPEEVMLVPAEDLAEQVRAVARRFPIDFAKLAFTRCSRDNTLLEKVAFNLAADRLPPLVRELRPDPVHHCPTCGRFYWPGTHTERIGREFKKWLDIEPQA